MAFVVFLVVFIWIGHAVIWTWLLNNLYGRKIPKRLLKPWRIVTGAVILFGLPFLYYTSSYHILDARWAVPENSWTLFVFAYWGLCLGYGAGALPCFTLVRIYRQSPEQLIGQVTHSLDYWQSLGPAVTGRGKWLWLTRIPFTCAFKVDFTDVTLKMPNLPKSWDGLTVLHLTDFHFHGTPAKVFFEKVFEEINTRWPTPDVIAVTGDFLDTDRHVEWIRPLFSTLKSNEGSFAILGNHDEHHHPDRIREVLRDSGFRVLDNEWIETSIRGEPCAVVGHEGPWFGPPPGPCPTPDLPKFCLSHSPDNIYWAAKQGCSLVMAGHVHGGQIRIPIIGPIFVPSIYSRRFDSGVFDVNGATLVVGRGLSGKEPIRFRCHPQIIRITIRV